MRSSEPGFSRPATGISGRTLRSLRCRRRAWPRRCPRTRSSTTASRSSRRKTSPTTATSSGSRRTSTPDSRRRDAARATPIYTTHLGISGNLPVSLQRFTADVHAAIAATTSTSTTSISPATPRARTGTGCGARTRTATLGYTETQGLASFNNIQGREPDLVTRARRTSRGNWLVTPRWKRHAGVIAVQTRHADIDAQDQRHRRAVGGAGRQRT